MRNWDEYRSYYFKKAGKRLGAIVLSAALFGGTAAAAFQGVNYVTGDKTQKTVQTTEQKTEKNVLQTVAAQSDGKTEGQSLDVSDVASSVMPSVVAITSKTVQEVQNYFGMFGMGGQPAAQEVESSGSGIIIGKNEEELLIVTNNHVVADASTLSVCFIDNNVYEATIKGTDADNDLAVIAVSLKDISEDTMSEIKVASVGDSENLKVGQQVVAIGNALGYGQSVTTGIVSALNRKIDSNESSPELIQTDAAINPGNSGGALLDMNGAVIGINSAKFASTEVEGMGYAIPISTASPIVENLMNRTTRQKVDEAKASAIGISGKNVTSEIEEAYGIPKGVYVDSVTQEGAAQKAGLKKGDVITKFDGTSISSIEELKQQLQYYAAGETVEISVKSVVNGEYTENTLTITLDAAANTQSQSAQGQTPQNGLLQEGEVQDIFGNEP